MDNPYRGGPHDAVAWFGLEMHKKLLENAHKRGWDDLDFDYGLYRIRQEADELEEVFTLADGWVILDPQDAEQVIRECADIANFALMMAYKAASNIEGRR